MDRDPYEGLYADGEACGLFRGVNARARDLLPGHLASMSGEEVSGPALKMEPKRKKTPQEWSSGLVSYIPRQNWEKNGRERQAKSFKRFQGMELVGVAPLVNGPYLKPLARRSRKTKCEKVLINVKPFMASVYPNVKWPSRPVKNGETKRGKIKAFSRKSRNRLIRHILSLERLPDSFSSLTYDDSVLKRLGIDEMRERVHEDIHRMKAFVRKRFPDVWFLWRIEWKPRKMGECAGMVAPHWHGMWCIGNRDFEAFRCVILAEWLGLTGTENVDAFKVTLKEKSFQKLDGKRSVVGYVSKYVAKESDEMGFDTGRHWGSVGPVPKAKGIVIELDGRESAHLIRLLKRWLKSKRRGLGRYVERTLYQGKTGHVYLDEFDVARLLDLACCMAEVPF